METKITSEFVAKLARAIAKVGGALAVDKRNSQQNYDYVSSDAILTACGQALASEGLALLPSITSSEIKQVETTSARGEVRTRYDATICFAFVVTDGDGAIASTWYGYGSDYAMIDKAAYKAYTSGHGYFLRKLLCVGAGNEDGEHEAPRDFTPKSQTQPQPPSKPAEKEDKGEMKFKGKPISAISDEELTWLHDNTRKTAANDGHAWQAKARANLPKIQAEIARREASKQEAVT